MFLYLIILVKFCHTQGGNATLKKFTKMEKEKFDESLVSSIKIFGWSIYTAIMHYYALKNIIIMIVRDQMNGLHKHILLSKLILFVWASLLY